MNHENRFRHWLGRTLGAMVIWLGIGTFHATGQARPEISIQPTSQTIFLGSNAVLSVGVTGTGPFVYQWLLNGTNVPSSIVTTLAGGKSVEGGQSTNSVFTLPQGVAVDGLGNIYVADAGDHRVRKIDAAGSLSIVAGNGLAGFSGDGLSAVTSSLNGPSGLAVDSDGNVYVADELNSRIRKLDLTGTLSTVGGNGATNFFGYNGDGGLAIHATVRFPKGVAIDSFGNLIIAETGHDRIRRVDTNGIISTVAGDGFYSYNSAQGDGGPATNAEFQVPVAVATDRLGNLFIADANGGRVRRVGTNGIITTFVGSGPGFYRGDGAPATSAGLVQPSGLAFDGSGNLLIADNGGGDGGVRRIDDRGIIRSIVGGERAHLFNPLSGDGVPALRALVYPYALALDALGNLYFTEPSTQSLRKVPLGSPKLALTSAGPSAAGAYQVVVTSPYGSVTSAVANISVTLPPLSAALTADTVVFSLSGTPGRLYILLSAEKLESKTQWVYADGATADSNGRVAFHPQSVGSGKAGFFRATLMTP